MATTQIAVSDEALKAVDQYAKKYDIPRTEAADRMLGVAVSRLNALARYAKKDGGAAPAKKAAKKPAKAKGPIARKGGKAKA
jgi:hypothetical protein